MQLGMIGLGRMGASMVRRLLKHGHECVGYSRQPEVVASLVSEGAQGASSIAELVTKMACPRAIWIMVPADAVDSVLNELLVHISPGDIVIDGGNSYYHDDISRAEKLGASGYHYVDVGTSGGVAGVERGYCLMIGGEAEIVAHLEPIFAALAPGIGGAIRTLGRSGATTDAEAGFLHCGPHGAGHFVKMVHNGIEYGIMAAYAEGLNILRHANIGAPSSAGAPEHGDAETTPMRHPEFYRYQMDLPEIAEVWRRGSVISSWLLDLTAKALLQDPQLAGFAGRVSDSGEGRWTLIAAIDQAVPTPVLSAAVHSRFASRGEAHFANQVLSAMRHEFGGHAEKASAQVAQSAIAQAHVELGKSK